MPFVKGQSGNPGGKSKADAEFKKLCVARSREALDIIASIMRTGEPGERMKAAIFICEQAHGKASQAVELSGSVEVVTAININRKVK